MQSTGKKMASARLTLPASSPLRSSTPPSWCRNSACASSTKVRIRRKDFLGEAETTEVSVRLGNYSASHFEGMYFCLYMSQGNMGRFRRNGTAVGESQRGSCVVCG